MRGALGGNLGSFPAILENPGESVVFGRAILYRGLCQRNPPNESRPKMYDPDEIRDARDDAYRYGETRYRDDEDEGRYRSMTEEERDAYEEWLHG